MTSPFFIAKLILSFFFVADTVMSPYLGIAVSFLILIYLGAMGEMTAMQLTWNYLKRHTVRQSPPTPWFSPFLEFQDMKSRVMTLTEKEERRFEALRSRFYS